MTKRPKPQNLKMVLLVLSFTCCACSSLRPGDLLFHVVEHDNHITEVTPGMIDHVAIYLGGDSVLEAVPRSGVVVNPLSVVLEREPGSYLRGTVRGADRRRSLQQALGYRGCPYDSLYLPEGEAIYCSELVQLSYVDKNGAPLFQPIPMSFHDADGHITPYWQQFYARQGLDVPEGRPGTNPSEMALRPQVIIKKLKY